MLKGVLHSGNAVEANLRVFSQGVDAKTWYCQIGEKAEIIDGNDSALGLRAAGVKCDTDFLDIAKDHRGYFDREKGPILIVKDIPFVPAEVGFDLSPTGFVQVEDFAVIESLAGQKIDL